MRVHLAPRLAAHPNSLFVANNQCEVKHMALIKTLILLLEGS